MSQRQAYLDAYPNAADWKPKTVDEAACRLEADCKISARLKEIREEENEKISQEAAWTRQKAFSELQWLISKAKEEIENKGEISSPAVSAVINSVKELNTIYAVAEKDEGGGVLEDILSAVRGINND
jgi:hypothetical protein